jgi:hypothetical protein
VQVVISPPAMAGGFAWDQTVPSALATGEIRKFPEPALSGVLQISPSSLTAPSASSRSASG